MATAIEGTWTKSTYLVPQLCGECGITFGFPDQLRKQRQRDGKQWYCPNGHRRVFKENDTTRLERAEARNQHLTDQLQASQADAENTRRTLVRERSRFANGVCPCCNRSFSNVRRHMETQHPDYDVSRVDGHQVLFRCTCGRHFKSYQGLRTHQSKTTWGKHLTKV